MQHALDTKGSSASAQSAAKGTVSVWHIKASSMSPFSGFCPGRRCDQIDLFNACLIVIDRFRDTAIVPYE